MIMENKIKHVGVVESVNGGRIQVRIIQSSACASCKAAKQCHTSESKEKVVDIYSDDTEYVIGQRVMVMASYKVGLVAFCLAMLVPLVLMTSILFLLTACGYDEITAAVVSLLSLIPYYIILFIFRNQINKRVTFTIEKL